MVRVLAAAALALAAAAPAPAQAQAQAQACRLALTIGMDVSASIDEREHALQREGLALALTDADVVEAFLAGPGVVTLHVYEWSGRARQTLIHDWVRIEAPGDLDAVAAVLRTAPRADREFPTAVGQALGFAAREFDRVDCDAYMIDLSGDGENNDGIQPQVAIREFGLEAVTVNALVVGGNLERLRRYFETQVINGPAAFVEVAVDFEDFAEAMRRKLIRELGPIAGLAAAEVR